MPYGSICSISVMPFFGSFLRSDSLKKQIQGPVIYQAINFLLGSMHIACGKTNRIRERFFLFCYLVYFDNWKMYINLATVFVLICDSVPLFLLVSIRFENIWSWIMQHSIAQGDNDTAKVCAHWKHFYRKNCHRAAAFISRTRCLLTMSRASWHIFTRQQK